MKRTRKAFFMLVVIALVLWNLNGVGWPKDQRTQSDPVADEWNMMDLLLARPLALLGGIVGTAAFVLSLPFTVPTRSVNDAAKMLVVKPFDFAFVREFPDDDMDDM